jgi:hypothetical protein
MVFKTIYGTIYFEKVKFAIFFNLKLNIMIVWIPHPNKHVFMNIDSNYIYILSTIIKVKISFHVDKRRKENSKK